LLNIMSCVGEALDSGITCGNTASVIIRFGASDYFSAWYDFGRLVDTSD
jgi:hypothetical protein